MVAAQDRLGAAARIRLLSLPHEPLFLADWDRALMIHFEVDAAALARLQIAAAKPATTVSVPRGSVGGTRQYEAAASFLHVPTL